MRPGARRAVVHSLAAAACVTLVTVETRAGAGTQAKGSGILILAASRHHSLSRFDTSARRVRLESAGEVTRIETQLYAEFGLTDRATLLASVFLTRPSLRAASSHRHNFGLSDSDLGLRWRLGQGTSWEWSIQGLVKVPTSKRSGQPAIAAHQTDLEGLAGVGGRLRLFALGGFWTADAGYRYRAGWPCDELRASATLGLRRARVTFLQQVYGVAGLARSATGSPGRDPAVRADYDLLTVQSSLLYALTPRVSLQAGYVAQVAGRNTAAGDGVTVALWWSF